MQLLTNDSTSWAGADVRQILRQKNKATNFIPRTAERSTIFRQTEKRVALQAVHGIRRTVRDTPSIATFRRSFPDDT
jgi:hypothetical protein